MLKNLQNKRYLQCRRQESAPIQRSRYCGYRMYCRWRSISNLNMLSIIAVNRTRQDHLQCTLLEPGRLYWLSATLNRVPFELIARRKALAITGWRGRAWLARFAVWRSTTGLLRHYLMLGALLQSCVLKADWRVNGRLIYGCSRLPTYAAAMLSGDWTLKRNA
jgi:hypothetical protein